MKLGVFGKVLGDGEEVGGGAMTRVREKGVWMGWRMEGGGGWKGGGW